MNSAAFQAGSRKWTLETQSAHAATDAKEPATSSARFLQFNSGWTLGQCIHNSELNVLELVNVAELALGLPSSFHNVRCIT
jgi:hypothetical protein